MESKPGPDSDVHSGKIGSGVVALARLMWIFLGPALLLPIAYAIVTSEGWFTIWDVAFFVVVAMMAGGRWLEQRSGLAMTSIGEPAGAEHFRGYVRIQLPVVAAVWVAANVLGNHLSG